MKSYTIEQIEYLRKIHLETFESKEKDEWWVTDYNLYDRFTKEFINWLILMEKENKIIDLLDDYLHPKI